MGLSRNVFIFLFREFPLTVTSARSKKQFHLLRNTTMKNLREPTHPNTHLDLERLSLIKQGPLSLKTRIQVLVTTLTLRWTQVVISSMFQSSKTSATDKQKEPDSTLHVYLCLLRNDRSWTWKIQRHKQYAQNWALRAFSKQRRNKGKIRQRNEIIYVRQSFQEINRSTWTWILSNALGIWPI